MSGALQVDALLRSYRAEVLRWNRQISLVSRQDSEDVLDRLLGQCREGLALLMREEPPVAGTAYFDLGSGGGLPGVVWHLLLAERGLAPRTCLVEPREKRAWFLDRLRGLPSMPDFRVSAHRWGEEDPRNEQNERAPGVLVSLKALKLTDPVILEGLPLGAAAGRLTIARYYPPGEPWTDELARDLQIFEPGTEVAGGGVPWRSTSAGVLAGGDFSLVVSTYEAHSS